MPLPDFELGPLEMQELIASEKAVAPASAMLSVNGRDVLLRACQGSRGSAFLFLRLDFPSAPVLAFKSSSRQYRQAPQFWSQGEYELCPPFENLYLTKEKTELASLTDYLLLQGEFSRELSFGSRVSDKPMRLLLQRGRCAWAYGGNYSFQLPYPTDNEIDWLLQVPDVEVLNLVSHAIEDAKSDCYFAWKWAQLDWYAQMRFMARFVRGNYDEFLKVLQCLTYLIALGNASRNAVEWLISLSRHTQDKAIERTQTTDFYTLISHAQESPEAIMWVEKWFDVIYAYFLPHYDASLERYSVIKHIAGVSRFEIYCLVPVPTNHERLEARLHLREWLQGKVPDEEIPFLLGEAA